MGMVVGFMASCCEAGVILLGEWAGWVTRKIDCWILTGIAGELLLYNL